MDVKIKKSGTKQTIKLTPNYPLESIRPLDNVHGERGTQNKPHAHIKLPKWLRSKHEHKT